MALPTVHPIDNRVDTTDERIENYITYRLSNGYSLTNANGDDPLLAGVEIGADYWKQINNDKFDQNLLRGNAIVTREINSFQLDNWFFLKLRPFTISEITDLVFEWKDIETSQWKNKNSVKWKEGMCLDFVQIEQLQS